MTFLPSITGIAASSFRALLLFVVDAFNRISVRVARWTRGSYHLLVPYATYAPWLKDAKFQKIHDRIRAVTMVNLYQCWELWELAGEALKIPGDLLEVGTWRGGSLALLAARVEQSGLPRQVFGCDTFAGMPKASSRDNYYEGGEHADATLGQVKDLLGRLGLTNATPLPGLFPEETGARLRDRTFCFCHIDVDTYLSARDTLTWLWPRLSVGGLVVLSDFGFPRTKGITAVVEERRREAGCVFLHNLNGNGVLIKVADGPGAPLPPAGDP